MIGRIVSIIQFRHHRRRRHRGGHFLIAPPSFVIVEWQVLLRKVEKASPEIDR